MTTVAKQKKETFFQRIARNWKTNPMFSTGCVLVLMIIVQTIALGFNDASFGAWLQRWEKNWINILRNNAGVGIVALGMTFVIISGGIDLAVGSTMVAIGAVLMVIINGYPAGLLTAVGITGVPAYLIGILAAVLVGCLIGGHQRHVDRPQQAARLYRDAGHDEDLPQRDPAVYADRGREGAHRLSGHRQHQDRRRNAAAHSVLAGYRRDPVRGLQAHALRTADRMPSVPTSARPVCPA